MKAEISDYVKTLIQRTREGSHVIDGKISQDRVVGYFETILVGLEELEAKAAKWDMIQWAVNEEIQFVQCVYANNNFNEEELLLDRIDGRDLKRLEQLYKEREKSEK